MKRQFKSEDHGVSTWETTGKRFAKVIVGPNFWTCGGRVEWALVDDDEEDYGVCLGDHIVSLRDVDSYEYAKESSTQDVDAGVVYRVVLSCDGGVYRAIGEIMHSPNDAIELFRSIVVDRVSGYTDEFASELVMVTNKTTRTNGMIGGGMDMFLEASVRIERCDDYHDDIDDYWAVAAEFGTTMKYDM